MSRKVVGPAFQRRIRNPAQIRAMFAEMARRAGAAGSWQAKRPILEHQIQRLAALKGIYVRRTPRVGFVGGFADLGRSGEGAVAILRRMHGARGRFKSGVPLRGAAVPKVVTKADYLQALHELGHHLAPGGMGSRKAGANTVAQEARAWEFALRSAEATGVKVGTRHRGLINVALVNYSKAYLPGATLAYGLRRQAISNLAQIGRRPKAETLRRLERVALKGEYVPPPEHPFWPLIQRGALNPHGRVARTPVGYAKAFVHEFSQTKPRIPYLRAKNMQGIRQGYRIREMLTSGAKHGAKSLKQGKYADPSAPMLRKRLGLGSVDDALMRQWKWATRPQRHASRNPAML